MNYQDPNQPPTSSPASSESERTEQKAVQETSQNEGSSTDPTTMKPWVYENKQWTELPPHLEHLPVFSEREDFSSLASRKMWAFVLRHILFRFYVRLRVHGSYQEVQEKYPRLILISNHASHLDAVAIIASIPIHHWLNVYVTAAKDYFFTNWAFTLFSKYFLGAIPIDRKGNRTESIEIVVSLLKRVSQIWLILFPEGTRSPDGTLQPFRKGVSVFSEGSNTPILFLYLHGNQRLWPKGGWFPRPGRLDLYVGPVHQPASVETLDQAYRQWVGSIAPSTGSRT